MSDMDDLYGSPQDGIADDRPCEFCGKSIWFGSATECGRFHLGCEVKGLRAALQSEKDAHAATKQELDGARVFIDEYQIQRESARTFQNECARQKFDAIRERDAAFVTVAALVAALERILVLMPHALGCPLRRCSCDWHRAHFTCNCEVAAIQSAIDAAKERT